MSTGYRRPQGGNAFQQYAGSGRDVDPLEVDFKKHNPGGFIRLRFLDLTEDTAVVLEGREVEITNPRNNTPMKIKMELPVDENGDPLPELKDMVDHYNTPVLACKRINIYRCPVWVYFEVDDKGNQTEINALRYLEFTQGLRDSMDELVSFQNGVGSFNEETGRPDYDVDLRVVKGEGTISKNYQFDVVYLDARTKRQHVNFGIEAEEVLKDSMDEIEELWGEVIERMNKRVTLEEFTKNIARRESRNRDSVSARPGYGNRQDEEQTAAPEPGEAAPASSARPGGRKYGR